MNQGETIEALAGLAALGVGLSYYLGWANVLIGVGVLLIGGAVIPAWRRYRAAR